MNFKLKKLLPLILLPALTGCIATSQEMIGLKDDIDQLRTQLMEVQKNQASLSVTMDSLNTNITELTERLDNNKTQMSSLAQRMDDVQANLGQRMDVLTKHLSAGKEDKSIIPPPSDLYKLAYSDYLRGKYDLAMTGFRSYLDKYPGTELSSQAQYYLADSYFNKQNYESAISELTVFFEKYPKSDLVKSAKFRLGKSLAKLNKLNESKKVFELIIKQYPASSEAEQSKSELKTLK
jgi:tol-pal system protein YbgF